MQALRPPLVPSRWYRPRGNGLRWNGDFKAADSRDRGSCEPHRVASAAGQVGGQALRRPWRRVGRPRAGRCRGSGEGGKPVRHPARRVLLGVRRADDRGRDPPPPARPLRHRPHPSRAAAPGQAAAQPAVRTRRHAWPRADAQRAGRCRRRRHQGGRARARRRARAGPDQPAAAGGQRRGCAGCRALRRQRRAPAAQRAAARPGRARAADRLPAFPRRYDRAPDRTRGRDLPGARLPTARRGAHEAARRARRGGNPRKDA